MIDFPTPVERADPDAGAEELQRPQPADAPRPGLGAAHAHPRPAPPPPSRRTRPGADAARTDADEREIAELRAELQAHPCHACPDREDHARWAERWFKLRPRRRDAASAGSSSAPTPSPGSSTGSARCSTALGYLERRRRSPTAGRHLMRIYSELDLVAAESLRHGLWDDLSPSELAAALSVLVFEARRPDDASLAAAARRRGSAR